MARLGFADMAVSWLGRQTQKRVRYSPSNVYLEGAYKPVRQESTVTDLKVTGAIPVALDGLLARIGPNPMEVPNPAAYHWFLGDGMVHGLRLREGRALWYRSRWVGTDSVNRRLQRPLAPGPRRGVVDTVNTNIVGHGGRLWAVTEAGVLPVEMDGELNTVKHGYFDSDYLRAITAHPHLDPETGELHAICYEARNPTRVHYTVIDPGCRVTRMIDIPVRHGPMIHDCALTRKYALVFDLPVTFSFREFLRGNGLPYRWNPAHPARVGLLPRDGDASSIRWCALADPCYVFHACNAFDEADGSVTVDVVAHAKMFDAARTGFGPEEQRMSFERWTLDPKSATVSRRVISERPQEFPRMDERRYTRAYRYAYTTGWGAGRPGAQPTYRYDLHANTVAEHHYGPDAVPGETVFVPKSGDAAEDAGWLLTCVYRASEDRSDVVIVDARNFGGEPVAVVHLPGRLPLGFHGNWINEPR